MTSDASRQTASVLQARLRVGMNSSQAFFKLVSENSPHLSFGTIRQARGQTVRQHQYTIFQRAQAFGPYLADFGRGSREPRFWSRSISRICAIATLRHRSASVALILACWSNLESFVIFASCYITDS